MLRGVFEQDSVNDIVIRLLEQHQTAENKITHTNLSVAKVQYKMAQLLILQPSTWAYLKTLPYGRYTIILLTVAFMIVCGMTTGGFIVTQLAGENPENWEKLMGLLGAIISANAQKSIFMDILLEAWDVLTHMTLKEFFSWPFIFAVLSTLCSGFINYALASFGAEAFIILVLGVAAGPPGWLMLAFAIFFGVMNALLVFSGKVVDLKSNDPLKNSWLMFFFVGLVTLGGLIMTFYPGVDELTKKFESWGMSSKNEKLGAYLLALSILLGTLWIEGCYAYKKITHMCTQRWFPDLTGKTAWESVVILWNKLCEVLNACTVFFIAAQGGKIFAAEVDSPRTTAPFTYPAGVLGTTISYAYTFPDPHAKDVKKDTVTPVLNQYYHSYEKINPKSAENAVRQLRLQLA